MPTQYFKTKNEMETEIRTAAASGLRPYLVYQASDGSWVVVFEKVKEIGL